MNCFHLFLFLVRIPPILCPNQIVITVTTLILTVLILTAKLIYRLLRTSQLTLNLSPTALHLLRPIITPNIPPPSSTST